METTLATRAATATHAGYTPIPTTPWLVTVEILSTIYSLSLIHI